MPRAWRIRYSGAKYHLTVRGNGRARVFCGPEDYERFLRQLDAALEQDQVRLYAYAILPNHYHLFIETPLGNVQRFMQRVNTAYGMYYRYKHHHPGHCFQGRYGAKVVAGDDYILALTRYIHLNPVKGKTMEGMPTSEKKKLLNGYTWSSYGGYAGIRASEDRIDYRWLSELGLLTERGNREAYRRYVEGMLAKDDGVFLEETDKSRYAIGDDRFRDKVESELKGKQIERAVTGDIVWPEDLFPGIDEVAKRVCDEFKVATEDLTGHGRAVGKVKALAVELCCRCSGASQREVAKRFGYGSESSVGKARQLARAMLAGDSGLARRVARIVNRCEAATF